MFRILDHAGVVAFRPIYHQTTPWPNPTIESILYDDARRGLGTVHCYGHERDGNYIITHRCGFTYVHFNSFGKGIGHDFPQVVDDYMREQPSFSHYLMFYELPPALMTHLAAQGKPYFKSRQRHKYRLDEARFEKLDPKNYEAPQGYRLATLVEAGIPALESLQHKLDSRFYNSWDDFLESSFGSVLFDPSGTAVAIAYTMCSVGRFADTDALTLPEFRNRGYAIPVITHLMRGCIDRKLEPHWDCFASNHTDKMVRELYGVQHTYLEYDMVTYLNRPDPAS